MLLTGGIPVLSKPLTRISHITIRCACSAQRLWLLMHLHTASLIPMAMVCAQFVASLDCTGKGMQLLQLLHTPEHSTPKMAARA